MTSIVDVCGFVDELGDDAVGELFFASNDAVQGSAFIERGRICWAAARGLAKRLTELLAHPAGLDAHAMEKLFAACKEAAIPGRVLVARGLLAPESSGRAAPPHHRVASPAAPSGLARASAREDRRLQPALHLHHHRGARRHARRGPFGVRATHGRGAPRDLSRRGVAPRSCDGQRSAPEPVAIHGRPPSSASMLLRAGKWAANALDLAAPFERSGLMIACTVGGGDTMVAWESETTILCGRTGIHGPARILHRRARARHTGGHGHGGL